jgi:A/G-specific adenine glycosylase
MKIGVKICGWYEKNMRDLPWRRTNDPYRVWISEIILQQTRVDQGIGYYNRFLERFPDVASLAAAPEDEVLKLWQGLGYYSRARNLHRAARDVVDRMGGKIPGDYNGLLGLKGVGQYTAAAIASICHGEPRAVVDGNVSRVIARLYGVDKPIDSTPGSRTIQSLAGALMEQCAGTAGNPGNIHPGILNQAMMEFGALQCVPSSPDCSACPLSGECEALGSGRVGELPVRLPKRRPVDRYMYFYIITCGQETILQKRDNDDIWKSLYQFPVIDSPGPYTREEMADPLFRQVCRELNQMPSGAVFRQFSGPVRHQLTHRTIHAFFIRVDVPSLPAGLPAGYYRVAREELARYPVPRLISRYMESGNF